MDVDKIWSLNLSADYSSFCEHTFNCTLRICALLCYTSIKSYNLKSLSKEVGRGQIMEGLACTIIQKHLTTGLERVSEIIPEMAASSGQELGHPARLSRRNCAKRTIFAKKKKGYNLPFAF